MRHSIDELENLGKEARRTALEMIASLGKGHVGGALSIVDLLVVLYYEEMNVDPANPQMPGVSAQNFWQKLSSKMAKEIEVIQGEKREV